MEAAGRGMGGVGAGSGGEAAGENLIIGEGAAGEGATVVRGVAAVAVHQHRLAAQDKQPPVGFISHLVEISWR